MAVKLKYPVYTLDSQLLLPAGVELTDEVLETLVSSGRGCSFPEASFLMYGSVKADILHFVNNPPYKEIFVDEREVFELLEIMERVRLPLPILRSLDYFKQKDPHTYRHILMVFVLSALLAKDLVPDYQDRIQETIAGPTHDFGKICIPLPVLAKRSPLTLSELDLLKHHTVAGYVLLIYYLQDPHHIAAKVARDHHERRNGKGYPRGICQNDPMVEIVAVSDIYDALISPRPYRPISFDNRSALEEITVLAEKGEIGWDVVKVLVSHNRKDKPHYTEISVSTEKRGTPPPNNSYGIIAKEPEEESKDSLGSRPISPPL